MALACRLASGLLALSLAACVETGDLGRPKRSAWSEAAASATGSVGAGLRGEPVSGFMLTDDERELRDRAWRYLTPAHERAWFDAVVADLVRIRALAVAAHPADPEAYHRALMSEARRSPHSAYRRIAEDALADARLVAPFVAVAGRVLAADRVRLASLGYVRELAPGEVHDAAARVAENLCTIAWVDRQAALRRRSYRLALERLVIEAPQGEAARVERAVAGLAHELARLRAVLATLPPEPACWGALEAVFVVEEISAPALGRSLVVK